eukprot:2287-Eustigmatos_ZCMA.PRE.1
MHMRIRSQVLSSAPDVFLILERVKEVAGGQQAFPCYRTEVRAYVYVNAKSCPSWCGKLAGADHPPRWYF